MHTQYFMIVSNLYYTISLSLWVSMDPSSAHLAYKFCHYFSLHTFRNVPSIRLDLILYHLDQARNLHSFMDINVILLTNISN